MRIGRTIGSVTLSRVHPSLTGAAWRLVVPLSIENLRGAADEDAEELVVYDDRGSGNGGLIAFSEGGEAAQPFADDTPVDAYNAAILDHVDVRTIK